MKRGIVMADLISRAAAIDAIISETIYPDRETIDKVCGASYSEDNGWVGGIRDAINAVEDVNAVDAVPVVRCKDCWKRGLDNCPMEFYWDSHPADDICYCAMGERREVGE